MKLLKAAFLAMACLGCVISHASETLPRIGDFSLLDHQGMFHQLSWYDDHKAVVIFVQGNGCPIVCNAAPTLKALRDEDPTELAGKQPNRVQPSANTSSGTCRGTF